MTPESARKKLAVEIGQQIQQIHEEIERLLSTKNEDRMIGTARQLAELGRAKCGHKGECIIGNYWRCLQGCDDETKPVEAVPEHVDPEREVTTELCKHFEVDGYGFIHRPTFYSGPVRICSLCGDAV